jgi:predicted RNA-binding Zn ribbon-like protein
MPEHRQPVEPRPAAPPPQAPPAFELSGGALGLDFANTWSDRGRPETEKLRGYADLLAFALQTGQLTAGEASRLGEWAERHPGEAATAFARCRELRESLYRIFSAVAARRAPPVADLERLNAALPEALARLRVERRGAGFIWTWRAPEAPAEPLNAPLWPLLRSAAELLTADERQQVRECAGSDCTWLFLDRSRNRSRRWCEMKTCGNRAKARRHYHRLRSRPGGERDRRQRRR